MPFGIAFDSLTGGGGLSTASTTTSSSGPAGGGQHVTVGGLQTGIDWDDALPVVAVLVAGLIAWRAMRG